MLPTSLASQWWNVALNGAEIDDMKAALRKGTYADLNIYSTLMQGNVLGCARTAGPAFSPPPQRACLLLKVQQNPE